MTKEALISSRMPQQAAREVQIGVGGTDGAQIGMIPSLTNAYSTGGWVGTTSAVDTNTGAGTFKSVLLCDRPAAVGGPYVI